MCKSLYEYSELYEIDGYLTNIDLLKKIDSKTISEIDTIFYGINIDGQNEKQSIGLWIDSHGKMFEGILNLKNNKFFGRLNDGNRFTEGFYTFAKNQFDLLNNGLLKNNGIILNENEESHVESTI